MTEETAISFLKQMKEIILLDPTWVEKTHKQIADAFDMGIEAIEQEPCKDAISRQAVLDTTICEGISCNECSFNDIDGESGCLLHHRISELPPVSPARPKGDWIFEDDKEHGRCPKCGTREDLVDGKIRNYCRVCGLDMRGDNNDT